MTISDQLRKGTKRIIDPIALWFNKLGISANQISFAGFLGNVIASIFLSTGKIFTGGIIASIMCPLDVIDGAVARVSGNVSPYGAMVDSTLDRYSEIVLLLGLLLYFLENNNRDGVILVFLALCGSFLVSYIRARGEGLDLEIKAGLLTRVERMIVLILSLLIGKPLYGVMLIAILGNITAFQRFWIARKMLLEREK